MLSEAVLTRQSIPCPLKNAAAQSATNTIVSS